jgi:hypothetical protein
MAKFCVIKLVLTPNANLADNILLHFKPENELEIRKSLAILMEMNIFTTKGEDENSSMTLSISTFIYSRLLLTMKSKHSHGTSHLIPRCINKLIPDKFALRTYVAKQLESLHLLSINICTQFAPFQQLLGILGFTLSEFKKIYMRTGIWQSAENDDFIITSSGTKYLLTDQNLQMHLLLREYMRCKCKTVTNQTILDFLFKLGHFEVEKPFHISSIEVHRRKIFIKMVQFGFFRLFHHGSWFSPTWILTNLSIKNNVNQQNIDYSLFVETNNRIYVRGERLISSILLNFIVQIDSHLPNFLSGWIVRQNYKKMFVYGFNPMDVYFILRQIAISKLTFSNEIPEVVHNHIDKEIKKYQRISSSVAILLIHYKNPCHFLRIESKAIECRVLTWSCQTNQTLAIRTKN